MREYLSAYEVFRQMAYTENDSRQQFDIGSGAFAVDGLEAAMQDYTIYSWYCPNCSKLLSGQKNERNQIKAKCRRCGAEMVRMPKSRRIDVMYIYASLGEERIGG